MSPQNDTPQHDDDPALILALDIWGDENMRGDALVAIEALKEAGFEITKRSELGISQGLPGIATSLTERFGGIGQAASDIPGKLESIALDASASAAAKAGMELASRLLSISADDRLAAALDLIGRRSDVVAVQLPERMRESHPEFDAGCGTTATHDGRDVALCLVGGNRIYRSIEMAQQMAAAILAAAADLAAANVADAAEDGAQ